MSKKINKVKSFPPALDRKIRMLTEGPLMGYQQRIFEDIRRKMEPYERYHKEILEATKPSNEIMAKMSEVIAANNTAIDLFRKSLPTTTWQLEIEKIHKSWADQFAPIQSMIKEMQAATALDLSSMARNITVSESITKAFSVLNIPSTMGLSSMVIEQLRAEERRLSGSLRGLVNSIAVPKDYLTLPYSSVLGASREVFTSSNAIGTLFPSIQEEVPFDLVEEERSARSETSDCVILIKSVDPQLVQLYQGSLDALNGSSVDKARHVLSSLRELGTQILHRLAPDKEVIGWINADDENLLHDGRPTRRARSLYICRNVGHGDLERFVQQDTASVVSLFNVFQRMHEVNPELTDEQLKALILRTESFITYVIQLWRETN